MENKFEAQNTEVLMKRIQHLEQEVSQLRRRADHDGLTGCLRREAFVTLIEKRRSFGLLGKNQSLVIMDIDHFKHINDQYGHQAGDDVLSQMAELLQKELPMGSLLCRMGGEEFIAVIPEELSSARASLENVRLKIEANTFENSKHPQIKATLSLGLVAWDSDTSLLESSARADAALYKAKNSGRNRIVVEEQKKSA